MNPLLNKFIFPVNLCLCGIHWRIFLSIYIYQYVCSPYQFKLSSVKMYRKLCFKYPLFYQDK